MRDPMKTLPRLLIFIFLSAHLAYAQTPSSSAPAAQTPKPAPCVASEYRQFDFWIGDWDVTVLNGKAAGTNLIKPILGGCVLHENWNGNGGFVGQSFNGYDATRKIWRQTWVDGQGGSLILEGNFENGRMTLSDKDTSVKSGASVVNEIAWTMLADGAVRQLWRTSADGGKTWVVAFDGKYVRSARPQPNIAVR